MNKGQRVRVCELIGKLEDVKQELEVVRAAQAFRTWITKIQKAAKKAGYTEKVFHADKNQPLNPKYKKWSSPKLPLFTTYEREGAEWFGEAIPLYAKSEKQAKIEDVRATANELGFKQDRDDRWPIIREATGVYDGYNENDLIYVPAVRDALIAKGFDSLRAWDVLENSEINILVPFKNPSQIKSADPVTRDSKGNVIPLSQRFNPDKDSILFSAPVSQPASPDLIRQMIGDIDADIAADESDREKALAKRQAGDLEVNPEISRIDRSL